MKKVIENIDISMKYRYNKVKKLIRKGYLLEALRYINKITRKADIYIDPLRPEIMILEYNNIDNIETLRIETFHGGVLTVIQLTNVKDKRELTIEITRTILMETPE